MKLEDCKSCAQNASMHYVGWECGDCGAKVKMIGIGVLHSSGEFYCPQYEFNGRNYPDQAEE